MKDIVTGLLMLATIGLLVILIQLNLRIRDSQERIDIALQKYDQIKRVNERHEELWRRVSAEADRQAAASSELCQMIADCETHSDFVVREGPWIAVGPLLKDADPYRVVFYVPAGGHVLRFATEEFSLNVRQSDFRYQQFFRGDTRRLKTGSSFTLAPAPGVYELAIEAGLPQPTRMQLRAMDDRIVADQPLIESATDYRWEIHGPKTASLAYPSELIPKELRDSTFQFHALPRTEVLRAVGRSERSLSVVRVWIESAAPACIGAMNLALHFDETLAQRAWRRFLSDIEFGYLFTPYRGNGRFEFHPHVFPPPQPSWREQLEAGNL